MAWRRVLRMPWFEGGHCGRIGAQRAEYDAAVELYNDTLLDAMREVADSLSAWHTTNETRGVTQAVGGLAGRRLEIGESAARQRPGR